MLAELVVDLIELQHQQILLLQQSRLLKGPLRETVLRRLGLIAEKLDASSGADFPHELPIALNATVLRLQRPPDHDHEQG